MDLPDGTLLGVARGGAGHLGIEGRLDAIRSKDGGRTWTPPATIVDSSWDDRDHALGVTPAGTVILAYMADNQFDDAGNYFQLPRSPDDYPRIEVYVTRSTDGGLTWTRPFLRQVESLRTASHFGKMTVLADGTILQPTYDSARRAVIGDRIGEVRENAFCSYIVRSSDDGLTWGEPVLLLPNTNESTLLALLGGDVLAVARGDNPSGLSSTHSSDGGRTWSAPSAITGPGQHPADLSLLANGDVLLTYGNRNPPYRVEGRVSRDGGRTWLEPTLVLSGQLYGYHLAGPRPQDMGYPSTAFVRDGAGRRGVTLYYYNPSLNHSPTYAEVERRKLYKKDNSPFYSVRDYRTVAISWSEAELIDAIGRAGG